VKYTYGCDLLEKLLDPSKRVDGDDALNRNVFLTGSKMSDLSMMLGQEHVRVPLGQTAHARSSQTSGWRCRFESWFLVCLDDVRSLHDVGSTRTEHVRVPSFSTTTGSCRPTSLHNPSFKSSSFNGQQLPRSCILNSNSVLHIYAIDQNIIVLPDATLKIQCYHVWLYLSIMYVLICLGLSLSADFGAAKR